MNKRGLSFALDILPGIILAFALVASTIMTASLGQVDAPDTLGHQTISITNRLLHSPNGISYVDPITQRVYPYIIDADKFGERIEENLYYGSIRQENSYYAAKIRLNEEEMYYNKDGYDRWRPIAERPILGGREKSVKNISISVLIKQGDNLLPGKLNIEVVARP